MDRVLVTGGAGFIGSALVRALTAKGNFVRILDNFSRGRTESVAGISNVEILVGDVREYTVARDACSGMDVVYHLAAVNGTEAFYSAPDNVLEVGVKGVLNVMEAASMAKTFVYVSSSEVYHFPSKFPTPETVPCVVPDVHNPRYSYSGSKICGELLALHYLPDAKFKRVILRPHNVYGPAMGFDHVVPQLIAKVIGATGGLREADADVQIQGTGDETRAFCFITDAVAGMLLAAQKGTDRQIYNVGVKQETPIKEIVHLIAEELGVTVRIRSSTSPIGGTSRRCPDVIKLASLGYSPSVSLFEGLQKTTRWYQDHYKRCPGDLL